MAIPVLTEESNNWELTKRLSEVLIVKDEDIPISYMKQTLVDTDELET